MACGLGPSRSVSYHWCGFEVSFQNWLVACVCVCVCVCVSVLDRVLRVLLCDSVCVGGRGASGWEHLVSSLTVA